MYGLLLELIPALLEIGSEMSWEGPLEMPIFFFSEGPWSLSEAKPCAGDA